MTQVAFRTVLQEPAWLGRCPTNACHRPCRSPPAFRGRHRSNLRGGPALVRHRCFCPARRRLQWMALLPLTTAQPHLCCMVKAGPLVPNSTQAFSPTSLLPGCLAAHLQQGGLPRERPLHRPPPMLAFAEAQPPQPTTRSALQSGLGCPVGQSPTPLAPKALLGPWHCTSTPSLALITPWLCRCWTSLPTQGTTWHVGCPRAHIGPRALGTVRPARESRRSTLLIHPQVDVGQRLLTSQRIHAPTSGACLTALPAAAEPYKPSRPVPKLLHR